MTQTTKSSNDGRAYVPVGNHSPSDSVAVAVPHIAIQAVAGSSGTVVVTNHQDVETTLYMLLGQVVQVNCKLIKATGNITSFALLS